MVRRTESLVEERELLDAAGIIVRYDDRQPVLPDEIEAGNIRALFAEILAEEAGPSIE